MKCWLSTKDTRFEPVKVKKRPTLGSPEAYLVKVYPSFSYQKIIGFGAALTEASGYVYSQMDAANKERFLQAHFGKDGNRYNFCRIAIQSSDFSLAPRAYVDDKRDVALETFSLGDDEKYVLPLARDAVAAGEGVRFLASPWSPPGWAKTNKSMKRGGRLRRKYYGAWAAIIARSLAAYREQGVEVTHLTVQNEPNARQRWESCLFSAKREREFVSGHLRPALDAAGLADVRILVWDHNKEGLVDRVAGILGAENGGARQVDQREGWQEGRVPIDGAAFHWYSGDHFDAVRTARELLGPERDLIFTEGCDAFSAGSAAAELAHAEHYAPEVIGDLEAGANAIIDWNILLDSHGGPNHVGNFCDAPAMYDTQTGALNIRLPQCYLGHFSRFIQPGAVRVLTSSYTVQLETTAFANPDGSFVLVVLNRNNWPVRFDVRVEAGKKAGSVRPMQAPAHSIMTFTW